jgi:two-component system, NtrC family, sensor kinase
MPTGRGQGRSGEPAVPQPGKRIGGARERPLQRTIGELEAELDQERHLSAAKTRLLEANIGELNDVYAALREKLTELRLRGEKIKAFEEGLVRANKLAALGELAGSIAHEIKNPLIAIEGFAERIGKTDDRERIARYAKTIGKEAQRLSKVLINLLDFSRMNEPKREVLDVNDLVDDTVLFMEHHLTRFRNVRLTVEKGQGLPRINADRIQIQQILVNIIMNAAQAMPEGGTIAVTTASEDGLAGISVADSGPGIRPEDIGKIFEPFFTTKMRGEGTGLGLPLCKRLIEANKGTIEVESRVGKGATFRLLIPPADAP